MGAHDHSLPTAAAIAAGPDARPASALMLEVAALMDDRRWTAAQAALCALPAAELAAPQRTLVLSLWRRLVRGRMQDGELDGGAGFDVLAGLDALAAAREGDAFWRVADLLGAVSHHLGHEASAALLLGCLGDRFDAAPHWFRYLALTEVFLGDSTDRLAQLWRMLLVDRDFVPDFWQFQSLYRSFAQDDEATAGARVAALCADAGRDDLAPLIAVYAAFLHRRDPGAAFDAALALADPAHRREIAAFLVGASQSNEWLPRAVEVHDRLAGPDAVTERAYMGARLAALHRDWALVEDLTGQLFDAPALRFPGLCLRALALAARDDRDAAMAALEHVRRSPNASWYLRGRAALVGVEVARRARGAPPLAAAQAPALAHRAGRPLAMSLWVGPRLRWIEEMSIRSFLLNGWRYQLYVYDPPGNLPDGVEVMDASVILPRAELFRESAGSGMHKGSLGAFSDLFRYALLMHRGGMWTDTDVINLDRFDPDGARFVSSEYTDAALIGPNGAMMALAAGDRFAGLALERARYLLDQEPLHFARIGPELLAELLAGDDHGIALMPPAFLNPVPWMETGALLNDFAPTAARLAVSGARNLHVYTETWRLIGLGLSVPPAPADGGFLAVLRERIMNAVPGDGRTVRDLIGGSGR